MEKNPRAGGKSEVSQKPEIQCEVQKADSEGGEGTNYKVYQATKISETIFFLNKVPPNERRCHYRASRASRDLVPYVSLGDAVPQGEGSNPSKYEIFWMKYFIPLDFGPQLFSYFSANGYLDHLLSRWHRQSYPDQENFDLGLFPVHYFDQQTNLWVHLAKKKKKAL